MSHLRRVVASWCEDRTAFKILTVSRWRT